MVSARVSKLCQCGDVCIRSARLFPVLFRQGRHSCTSLVFLSCAHGLLQCFEGRFLLFSGALNTAMMSSAVREACVVLYRRPKRRNCQGSVQPRERLRRFFFCLHCCRVSTLGSSHPASLLGLLSALITLDMEGWCWVVQQDYVWQCSQHCGDVRHDFGIWCHQGKGFRDLTHLEPMSDGLQYRRVESPAPLLKAAALLCEDRLVQLSCFGHW